MVKELIASVIGITIWQEESVNQLRTDIGNTIGYRKWEECDTDLYGSTLEKLLEETFDLWAAPENFPVLASVIPNCFLQAAEIAVPSKQTRKGTFKINKSPEWRKAELDAKNAFNKWKVDGKPRNDESVTFKIKKESQSNLRRAIKEHNLNANIE